MKKKLITAGLFFTIIVSVTMAQSTSGTVTSANKPVPHRTPLTEETIVSGLLKDPDAFYRGVGTVHIHRMGDLAATAIIGIIGSGNITESQTSESLDIIHKAFEDLDALKLQFREPKHTLFLLNYLGNLSQNSEVTSKIKSTREFILQAHPKVQ